MRRRSIQRETIKALTKHPDGLTMHQIAECICAEYESVRMMLQRSRPPGIYIDEWIRNSRGPLSAVYKIVQTPADAPKSKHRIVEPIATSQPAQAPVTQGLTRIRGPWFTSAGVQ